MTPPDDGPRLAHDAEREERITNEAIVDAYGPYEQAIGWWYYLDARISPFRAVCVKRRRTSPLKVGRTIDVLGMADEAECRHEMFVRIAWEDDELAVPLAQLEPVDTDEETDQAVRDWIYWVAQGREF